MVTIKDIASELGLSTSTVSRALTDSSSISLETKQKVKDAAKRMNYTVNRFASNLASSKSKEIGFMIPDIEDTFFSKCAYGIEDVLISSGYSLAYTHVNRDPNNICEFLKKAEEYCYQGMFITIDDWTPEICSLLTETSMPVILLRRKTPDNLKYKIPYVDSDCYGGMLLYINHLHRLGHRIVGYIGYETPVGQERTQAFMFQAEKKNFTVYSETIFSYHKLDIRISAGYFAAQKLLEEHNDITALCAGDDGIAVGALQYLYESGLSVPEDVSVIGYDDIAISSLYSIQLTTIHQQRYEIGKYAGRMMLDMIKSPDFIPQSISLPTLLKSRRTTGRVRQNREIQL